MGRVEQNMSDQGIERSKKKPIGFMPGWMELQEE